jgi:HSP20 family molecular chaperone IbpA
METTDIENKTMERLFQELDAGSCRMLLFLLKYKHAKLDQLTEILGESCQMNTLVRIKKFINPKSVEILKRPALAFEESRIDKESGENILFSWWLNEEDEKKEVMYQEQFADIFNEENEILIIIDLKGGKKENVRLKIDREKGDILFRDSSGWEHIQQISLPDNIDTSKIKKQFQNQTLIFHIPKR